VFSLLNPARFTLLLANFTATAAIQSQLSESLLPWRELIDVFPISAPQNNAQKPFEDSFDVRPSLTLVRPRYPIVRSRTDQVLQTLALSHCSKTGRIGTLTVLKNPLFRRQLKIASGRPICNSSWPSAMERLRMVKTLLVALFLLFSHCFARDAQPPAATAVDISVSRTPDPYVFKISLRNVSGRGFTVVLGSHCSGVLATLEAIHYRLTNIYTAQVEFSEMGMPCTGTFGPFTQDLPPGEDYSYEMDLRNTTLGVDEDFLKVLTSEHQLFNLQAVADGQKGFDPWVGFLTAKDTKYPLWTGQAISRRLWLAPSASHLNPQP
jgi:hypothetical protein